MIDTWIEKPRTVIADATAAAWRSWCHFWFEAQSASRIRLFQRAFAVLMFMFYAVRTFDLQPFYSEQGLLPIEVMKQVVTHIRPSILVAFPSDAALYTAHFAFMACMAAIFLGRFTRVAALIAYLIHVSFIHRNVGSVYGVDFIATFYLLYLTVMKADASKEKRTTSKSEQIQRDLSSVGFRLAQIQLCIIYLYSGVGKLKGSHWWSGEAVWDVLANVQLARWDFTWLSNFPTLVALLTYSTLIWEIYFCIAIWVPRLRYPMLIGGVLLHIGIALGMNLVFFGAMMGVVYLLFLEEKDAAALEKIVLRSVKS